MRNFPTPKINISDASVYDSIVPEKPKSSHSRSKSLDKPVNLTLVDIPVSTAPTTSKNNATVAVATTKNNEKQTVNYATLEHKVTLKTIKNNTKLNETHPDRCSYAEMSQSQKQSVLKQTKNNSNEDKQTNTTPKSNALKQIQKRANSAPESYKTQPPTVVYIPDDEIRREYKKCFETFPKEKRCQDGHRSRYDTPRGGSMGRSRSVPEQKYIITAKEGKEPSKVRKEGPVVSLQHSSQHVDPHMTITRTFANTSTPARSIQHGASLERAGKTGQANNPRSASRPEPPSSNTRSISTQSSANRGTNTRPSMPSASSQATPSRSSQYYSSQPFEGTPIKLPIGPFQSKPFENTDFNHSRATAEAINKSIHSTPSRSNAGQHRSQSFEASPRGITKPLTNPAKVSPSKRSISQRSEDAARCAAYQIVSDLIRANYVQDRQDNPVQYSRTQAHSFDSQSLGSQHQHNMGAPPRSSSLQQSAPARSIPTNKGTPKRAHDILQHSSKSLDTPPRSSSLHQYPAQVTAPTRTASLQHAASADATPTRTQGILKNRRRSRSRELEEGRLSPGDTCDNHNREILLTIKKQSQGYMKPP